MVRKEREERDKGMQQNGGIANFDIMFKGTNGTIKIKCDM